VKKILVLLVVLLFSVLSLAAVEEETYWPAWKLLDKAKVLYEENRLGDSIAYLYAAKRKSPDFPLPEADYYLGLIFLSEGETDLAENQLKEAISNKNRIFLPGTEDYYLAILYRLADLMHIRDDRKAEAEYLNEILSIQTENLALNDLAQREYQTKLSSETLYFDGFNEFLYLYRFDFPPYEEAYFRLGLLSYETHDYKKAALYLMLHSNSVLNRSLVRLKERDDDFSFPRNSRELRTQHPDYERQRFFREIKTFEPDYNFNAAYNTPEKKLSRLILDVRKYNATLDISPLSYALDKCLEQKEIEDYIDHSELFKSLFYLSCSLYLDKGESAAYFLWKTLKDDPHSGEWGRKAERLYFNPEMVFALTE